MLKVRSLILWPLDTDVLIFSIIEVVRPYFGLRCEHDAQLLRPRRIHARRLIVSDVLLADFTAAALILKTDVVDVLEDHISLLHDGLCLCAI